MLLEMQTIEFRNKVADRMRGERPILSHMHKIYSNYHDFYKRVDFHLFDRQNVVLNYFFHLEAAERYDQILEQGMGWIKAYQGQRLDSDFKMLVLFIYLSNILLKRCKLAKN